MKPLKLVMAAVLISCLLSWHYAVYLLVRFVGLVVFIYFGYTYHGQKRLLLAIVFV